MKGLQEGLKFAASLEEIKNKERQRKAAAKEAKKKKDMASAKLRADKAAKVQAERIKVYDEARAKVTLAENEQFTKAHVPALNTKQLKAVAFLDCKGTRLHGLVADMRQQLRELLPAVSAVAVPATHPTPAPEYPEYATQDDLFPEGEESDEHATDTEYLEFEQLRVSECVQVYWKGEQEWFEGEVTEVDTKDGLFEVFYSSDGARLWHDPLDFPVRHAL